MAKSVGFGKLEREMISNDRLPPDLRMAIVEFKNNLKMNLGLKPYRGEGLPAVAHGQQYYERQVGEAHEGDPEPRGKRRLVALVDAGRNILKLYFTEIHYKGKWKQLQYP
jgi:hypothetical protein